MSWVNLYLTGINVKEVAKYFKIGTITLQKAFEALKESDVQTYQKILKIKSEAKYRGKRGNLKQGHKKVILDFSALPESITERKLKDWAAKVDINMSGIDLIKKAMKYGINVIGDKK